MESVGQSSAGHGRWACLGGGERMIVVAGIMVVGKRPQAAVARPVTVICIYAGSAKMVALEPSSASCLDSCACSNGR